MKALDGLRSVLNRPLASYQLVVGASLLLLGLGLIMVLSSSSVHSYTQYHNSYYIFIRQLIWAATGLLLAVIASRLPIRAIRALAYPALIIAFLAIGATFIPGIGIEVNGNQNWIAAGPLRLQPSELAKLAIILWSADLFARKERRIHETRHLTIPMVPVCLALSMLVVLQDDLGTALVLFAIIVGLLWCAGLSGRFMGATMLGLGILAIYFAASSENRVRRLTSFIDPFADPAGTGYQASNGLMALASGKFWGVGLGASQQKWGRLPEAHTDFVFAVIGEELGLFGTLVVLGLFGIIAYSGIRIAARASDPFIRLVSAGITVWLISQAAVNIGMVLALAPVIGIPLPLISYGGSGLLPTLVALGLLVNFAKREPGAARALAASRKRRGRTTKSATAKPALARKG